jgi:hypothetical protein
MTVNLPAFTSNPPQIHHQKTTFCTPFLPKPPAKTGKPARKKLLQKRSLFDPQAVTPTTTPVLCFDLPLPGKHLIGRLWASVKGAAGSDFVFIVFIEGPTAI